jgi:hypothetical protein
VTTPDDAAVRAVQEAEEVVGIELMAQALVRDLRERGPSPSPRLLPLVLRRAAELLEDS